MHPVSSYICQARPAGKHNQTNFYKCSPTVLCLFNIKFYSLGILIEVIGCSDD